MNDSEKGGMTISSLLLMGLIVSLAVPEIVILILGVIRGSVDATTFTTAAAGAALVVLIGVLAMNYFVRRRIQDRLLSLVDVCRNFAGGDRAVRAPVSGDDEFAMLAMSLNSLLENQSISPGVALSGSGGTGEAATLQAQIEKLLQEVSAVGDGDLRVQAEVTPDTLGVLADSFNYMIEELAKVVGRVQATAIQVTNSTRRILDRSSELAQASETQVAQISKTTQAVEALAVFIQNVAHNARLSAEAAQEALQNADSGQEAVKQSIQGMLNIRQNVQETAKKIKRLGERSNEIGEIVRIIEDIADQTNLLALNAAIQSAMAGEHGRGFAVVADEIRLLAERSTESTKRIATLVKSIQGDTYEAVVAMEESTQEVVKGSQLADEAGQALNSIYTAVERQTQMIEGIAGAANEQAQVSESVAIAMSQISEITHQTNIGTQEASMSVSYLAELVDQLRASVSTFRLPERSNEMIEVFPSMEGVPALPGGDQFYQQGMEMSNDWNAGFSSDFLSLPQPPQPAEMGNSGSYQFAMNRQQDFPPQQNYGGMQQFVGQQGFEAQQYAGQPTAGGQYFGSQPGFPSYTAGNGSGGGMGHISGDLGGFDASTLFNEQAQFEAGQEAGFGNPNQGFYGGVPQANYQQNFGSQPGQMPFPAMPMQPGQPGQVNGPRPRIRSPQMGQPAYSQDQVPYQNGGYQGQ